MNVPGSTVVGEEDLVTHRSSLLVACMLCSAPWAAAGCGGAPATGSSTQARPSTNRLDDGQVLAIYDQTNTFDIETGRLGSARGASEEVRALGRMVVTDHTAVRDLASRLGAKLGITPRLPPARAAAAAA